MKKLLKRYWMIIVFALIINVPIIVLGVTRTNKEILLKGDTTKINSFVDVDTNYEELGSFSSIYVVDVERSTVLQNIFAQADKTSDVSDISISYSHISNMESYQIGQIQKNSSLMISTIKAYEWAKKIDSSINLDYSFSSFCVTYYFYGSPFKIGDKIIGCNDVRSTDGRELLLEALFDSKENDKVLVNRNNKDVEITLTDNAYKLCRWYSYFDINYKTAIPSISFNRTNTGGPSGGLLQTLSIFNKLTEFDYTRGLKISGTGTIGVDSSVGTIGGITQKVYTAFDDRVDVFFCPEGNYEDAKKAYDAIQGKEKMALVKVKNLDDAIRYLENV